MLSKKTQNAVFLKLTFIDNTSLNFKTLDEHFWTHYWDFHRSNLDNFGSKSIVDIDYTVELIFETFESEILNSKVLEQVILSKRAYPDGLITKFITEQGWLVVTDYGFKLIWQ